MRTTIRQGMNAVSRCVDAAGPTADEMHPPTITARLDAVAEGARRQVDFIRPCLERLRPSHGAVAKGSGLLAVGLLTAAVLLLRRVAAEGSASDGDGDGSGDRLTSSDALLMAGAIVTLVMGLACGVSCMLGAIQHCMHPDRDANDAQA
jgi:tetrahydromethanopterin S-methyltransferase subunit F